MHVVEKHEIYRTHMMDAKIRLVTAEKVATHTPSTLGNPQLDMEFCFLQVRRIIESITFSSMLREEARYTQLRKIQHSENPRDHGVSVRDWQASEILKRLVSLSPYALPIPIKNPTTQHSNNFHFDRQKITVNHGRLIELYEKCGGFLHAKNPLVPNFLTMIETERAKYEKAPKDIKSALEFLRKLLWNHAALTLDWTDPNDPHSLDSPKSAWIVDFGSNDNYEITLVLAEAL